MSGNSSSFQHQDSFSFQGFLFSCLFYFAKFKQTLFFSGERRQLFQNSHTTNFSFCPCWKRLFKNLHRFFSFRYCLGNNLHTPTAVTHTSDLYHRLSMGSAAAVGGHFRHSKAALQTLFGCKSSTLYSLPKLFTSQRDGKKSRYCRRGRWDLKLQFWKKVAT